MPTTKSNISNKANMLKLFMQHVGIRQRDLVQDLGLAKNLVSHYVNGRLKVPQHLVEYLIKRYKLNVEWWHTGKGKPTKDDKRTTIATDVSLLNLKIEKLYIILEFYKEQNHKLTERVERLEKQLNRN